MPSSPMPSSRAVVGSGTADDENVKLLPAEFAVNVQPPEVGSRLLFVLVMIPDPDKASRLEDWRATTILVRSKLKPPMLHRLVVGAPMVKLL